MHGPMVVDMKVSLNLESSMERALTTKEMVKPKKGYGAMANVKRKKNRHHL